MKLFRALRKGFQLLTDPVVRRQALNAVDAYELLAPVECSCCGFSGRFVSIGGAAAGSICPSCRSWERHRLFALALRNGFVSVRGREVLNCGPETRIWELVETAQPSTHREVARDAAHSDEAGSIECLRLPNASADLVIAVHSLEHVDDRKALTEIRRVLRPGGELIAMVPLVEGWARTYEDPTINAASDREAHFGHANHLRWYGADFRDLLGASGFSVEEFTAGPEDSVRFALQRGEKVFRAR